MYSCNNTYSCSNTYFCLKKVTATFFTHTSVVVRMPTAVQNIQDPISSSYYSLRSLLFWVNFLRTECSSVSGSGGCEWCVLPAASVVGEVGQRPYIYGDDALIYIAYVVLRWAPFIPATRWSCNRPQADSNDCRLQRHLVVGVRGTQISIRGVVIGTIIRSLGKGRGENLSRYPLSLFTTTHLGLPGTQGKKDLVF